MMVNAAGSAGASAVEAASAGASAVVEGGGNVLKRGWARLSRRKSKKKDSSRIVDEVHEETGHEEVVDQELPSSSAHSVDKK